MSQGSREGLATPEERRERPHQYVEVPVPAGAPALTVELDYRREAGVIDLGVFDPDGAFRGYSGGARDRFVITVDAATPGYLPGPLPAGEWRVFLRLHEVPAGGLPWAVRWSTSPAAPEPLPPPPPVPQRPPRRGLPAPRGRTWLAGDLHAHTVHSDGSATIDELAALAVGRGLDFLAVTDHNTVSHHPHLPAAAQRAGIDLLPGQEVTIATAHGNALGDVGWVDFREPTVDWAAHVHRAGGLLSVNHPVGGDCAWREALPEDHSHVEAWHGSWDRRDRTALRWWRRHGGVPVGGGDLHHPARGDLPGAPTTWVATDGDILSAIADGWVAVAEDPLGPALVRVDGSLVAVDADGTRLYAGDSWLDDGASEHGVLVGSGRVDLGARRGWHVLVAEDGRVVALSP